MIKAENIQKSFGSLQVLKGVDLHIKPNEIVTITGASGAGKTTMLQILGTLDRADVGEVTIDGIVVGKMSHDKLSEFRNSTIGFVFQFHQLLPEFTALENTMLPYLIKTGNFDKAKAEATQILAYLNLADRLHHKPNELSGGEKQRVAVARALINKPKVIFADEPSGSLDSKNKKELHQLLFKIRADFSTTILIVTHDKELTQIADRTLEMADGRFV
ncbi:lipoprotein ABC transporter ATP-binding protein [Porphyromonadaceae bacterium COT-184 OH4590]|nr:lipoprotein ABC transporter ATP-binding protein [Porphyromonadaceae bacterium COT-184 OH4590]MDO4726936.1 ABC transporter ATP-binding protein [Porphyromonadaceae bacterium]